MGNYSKSMGYAGAAMMGIGAISGALSARNAAAMQASSLSYQAEMSRINAATSERMAEHAMFAGNKQEQAVRLRTAKLRSSQKAGFAANGIDLSSASVANVLTSTDVMGEEDANTTHANAVRSAWGYRTQGVSQTMEGNLANASASGISPNGSFNASLMGSAGSVATNWYMLKSAGAFNGA